MNLPNSPNIDLFAAGINALNATLVARQPTHNRDYTLVGLLIIGFIGGIGGGLSRDIILNDLPGPFTHQSFLVVCLAMGFLGVGLYGFAEKRGKRFRMRTLSVMKSFTLPWFAILGAHKALEHDLGIFSAILVGVIATTAGGVVIDLFSGVVPEIVRPAEHLVTTAILASAVYAVIAVDTKGSEGVVPVTLIAVTVAFVFRLIAVRTHWEEIVPGTKSGDAPPGPSGVPVPG